MIILNGGNLGEGLIGNILKVQDHHIASQTAGLVDGLGVGGGHIEGAAARPCGASRRDAAPRGADLEG
mgnify:CR=1 FL=1